VVYNGNPVFFSSLGSNDFFDQGLPHTSLKSFKHVIKKMNVATKTKAILLYTSVWLPSKTDIGTLQEIIQQLLISLRTYSKDAVSWFYLGLCLRELSRPALAQNYLSRARAIDPTIDPYLVSEGVLQEEGKWLI